MERKIHKAKEVAEKHKEEALEKSRHFTDIKLRRETIKWLERLEKELRGMESTGKLPKPQFRSLAENMRAYVKDARHFMDKQDWVRAFEAVIYAYGIYETCLRVGIIRHISNANQKTTPGNKRSVRPLLS